MKEISFKALRVEKALAEVRVRHPRASGQPLDSDAAVLERVRLRLSKCADEELRHEVSTFTPTELAACMELIVLDREGPVADRAARALILRPRASLLTEAWRRLLRVFPHPLLESTVRALVEKLEFPAAGQSRIVVPWAREWLAAEDLVQGVLQHRRTLPVRRPLDSYLFRSLLSEADGLHKAVWRHLMTSGSREDLTSEGGSRLAIEFARVLHRRSDLASYGQHYLANLHRRTDWHDPIVEQIGKAFGEPAHSGRSGSYEDPFWTPIAPEVKEEFRTWRLLREIGDFFKDDERSKFWKHYAEIGSVRQVKRPRHVDGFLLDFGFFGIAEFKDIGNAAYVYPRDHFQVLWQAADSLRHPADFKQPHRTFSRWAGDGRILHFGGWQERARTSLQHLLRGKSA